ncbi:MAG: LytTR family DNA-binding domain-containing protein [Rikenellaceae bacterium]
MISCIVIDDEPLALQQIEQYVTDTPLLELRGSFNSTTKALEYLRENSVDLLFVDINMPRISGLEFVDALPFDVKVIFVTAYREYALEGFSLDAADYLLKPLSYAAFLKSVEKVNSRYFNRAPDDKSDREYTFLRSANRTVRVNFYEILYIESKREYLDIVLSTGDIVTVHGSLNSILEKLPQDRFLKVHRSFIVNLDKVKILERNSIVFEKLYIPINEQAKEHLMNFINNATKIG